MAWLGTWKYRHKITVDATKIDTANLTWFPVTVFLNTTSGSGNDDVSDIFDELTSDANRTKIALTTTDGTTQLYAEIEKWDDANETAILHVSKTGWVLDYDADTELYIYFDSSQSANTTYIGDINSTPGASVWDGNFKAVYHLADDNLYDSTSNNNDCTDQGSDDIAGKIGQGRDFIPANTDYIETNYTPADGDQTVECWAKFDDVSGDHILFHNFDASTYDLRLLYSANNITANVYDGTNYDLVNYAYSDTTNWHHFVAVRDKGTYIKLFEDGVEKDTAGDSAGTCTAQDYWIGRLPPVSADYMDGIIDEVRFSETPRLVNWLKATYNAGSDLLIKDYAAKEEIAATTDIKSFNNLAYASMKSIMGLGIADIKSINGLE